MYVLNWTGVKPFLLNQYKTLISFLDNLCFPPLVNPIFSAACQAKFLCQELSEDLKIKGLFIKMSSSEKKSDKKPAADKEQPRQTSEIVEPTPVVEGVLFNPNTELHRVTVSFYVKDLPKQTDIQRCIRRCHSEMQMATSKAKGKLIIGGSGGSGEVGLVASKSSNWTRTVSQNLKKAKDSLIKPLKSALKESAKPLKTANPDQSFASLGWSSKKSRSVKVGSTALGDRKSGGTNDEGTSQKYKHGKFHLIPKFMRHGSSASGDGSNTVGKEASTSVLQRTRSSVVDSSRLSEMKKDEGLQKNRQGKLGGLPKYVGEASASFARSQSVSVSANPRPSVVQRNSLPDMPPRASLGRSNSVSTVGSAHAYSPELRRNRSSPADAPPRRRRRLMIADDDDNDEAED